MAFEKKRVDLLLRAKLFLSSRHGLVHPSNLEGYVYGFVKTSKFAPDDLFRPTCLLQSPLIALEGLPEPIRENPPGLIITPQLEKKYRKDIISQLKSIQQMEDETM